MSPRRSGPALVLALLGLLVTPAGAGAEPSTGVTAEPDVAALATTARYTYEVEQRGEVQADFDTFRATVGDVLGSSMGWWRAGIDLQPVQEGGDFQVVLASPDVVASAAPVCSRDYSCRVGDQVLINDRNWRLATSAWTASLAAYRGYVVNHEVGHWLGSGHVECPGAGAPAPVMQQQSISLDGCAPNGWPLEQEIDRVAAAHGTDTRRTSDAEAAGPAKAGVVREGTWYLGDALSGGAAGSSFTYGRAGDVPVVGDWDGDGTATVGVFRDGWWYLRDVNAAGHAEISFSFGRAGDVPLVGDWNGDGVDTVGVHRDGTWYLRDVTETGVADREFSYGRAADAPVVGDWDGDGRDGFGVLRDGHWYLRQGPGAGRADQVHWFGTPDGTPVVGDWHGEGRDRLGFRRSAVWHLQHAGTVVADAVTFPFGRASDTPVVWR